MEAIGLTWLVFYTVVQITNMVCIFQVDVILQVVDSLQRWLIETRQDVTGKKSQANHHTQILSCFGDWQSQLRHEGIQDAAPYLPKDLLG